MPLPPEPREGKPLLVKGRPLQFTFWPMYRNTRRYGLQSMVFALDPWILIKDGIRRRCPAAAQKEALAYLEQSRDFFVSATLANVTAARPLQLYYSFLNLAKSLMLTNGPRPTLGYVEHGLSERLKSGGVEFVDAFLQAFKSPNSKGKDQCFDELLKTIAGTGLAADKPFNLVNLLPQILTGHRLWSSAAAQIERFISIHELEFNQDESSKRVWLRLYFFADDLTRWGITHAQMLQHARLAGKFHEVRCKREINNRKLLCFEQTTPAVYSGRPSDAIPGVVGDVRQFLWVAINTDPPYRRYYVYLAPPVEHGEVLPQISSIYAVMYYLGSIVRYRPQHFDSITSGKYGPRIEEFINGIPAQFIYLMASEFVLRQVTRPALVS